jgi:hypothetical protein
MYRFGEPGWSSIVTTILFGILQEVFMQNIRRVQILHIQNPDKSRKPHLYQYLVKSKELKSLNVVALTRVLHVDMHGGAFAEAA